MVDDNVAMMDDECTCHHKIAGLDVRKGIVEELVWVRRPVKWGNLEDERGAVVGSAAVRGNFCHHSFILRSIHHCKLVR